MEFKLVSDFKPTGDQPTAIKELVEGVNDGATSQVLLGVTGSGKTFTVANVIQETGRPTLVLSHNKTLAAQLFEEFTNFFPENKVEYFVSYYDYYQPEAYLPTTGTYIEKDLSINDEIEKLRIRAASSLLSGRKDVIVVSSVSCIYGIGNPASFKDSILVIKSGMVVTRNTFLGQLVDNLYSRAGLDFERGTFRVKGDTVDINLPYADFSVRISFWGDEIEGIETIENDTARRIEKFEEYSIYPANIFVTSKETTQGAIHEIQDDMMSRIDAFKAGGQHLEAKRLEERVTLDLEMIRELGYCSGIENYSRYFDGRLPGSRPFCLLDYFPDNMLMVIDESHVTLPQIRAMYGGDRSRKINLVEHGFRLPSAMDNRPLRFEEFEQITEQTIYVSATPADYELERAEGIYVEQLIRPTGLLDPKIEVRPSKNQIDDLLEEVHKTIAFNERVLATTLTKRMAEELQKYLEKVGVRSRYIHSDVDTLDRIEIIKDLRAGVYDVLVGVNLLREGLDLPEVSLIVILDADKEGFLRSERALVQTVGRAARNVNGRVIMYADKMTNSMQRTIDETERRRGVQEEHNKKHGITPTAIKKNSDNSPYQFENNLEKVHTIAAEEEVSYLTQNQVESNIKMTQKAMEKAAKEFDFVEAAKLRDHLKLLKKQVVS
ncbi:MAG: excinuclease ABC subunit UvrB [Flavobacteriales bacterium]|nr:excinuclease ABC subunit UvrB [Flavobacteriales bacterium]|tara:strand:+ start:508 stop:2493 length:1986 start_codon:yes stop_codon:yes gene_type:complete